MPALVSILIPAYNSQEWIGDTIENAQFQGFFFVRDYFFHAIVYRHFGKAVGWRREAMKKAAPLFRITKKCDDLFSRTNWMRDNQLMLIWGFDK